MKLFPVLAENMKLDGGACFGVVPKMLWNKIYPADENNMIEVALRNLLISEGDRLILIDAGSGNKQDDKFRQHFFLEGDENLVENIRKAGFSPEDVTDVLLTHLHFDHGGGTHIREASGAVIPRFSNASILISESHWHWATDANSREKASFLAENLQPLFNNPMVNLIAGPGELFPGIEIRMMNGHTEGQIIPFIRIHGKTVVFMADFIPSSAHISLPFIAAYDIRPLDAVDEKAVFLKEAADNGYILFFQHDALYECGTVQHTDKGIRLKETGTLAYFLNQ